jgi:tetratricopeptide (TPR) repeat protein
VSDAKRRPLPFEVRAIGEALRRFGAASSPGREGSLDEIRSAVAAALARHSPELVVRLRALQTELFLSATRRWEETGVVDSDLRELGGSFVERARANGWIAPQNRLLLRADQRATLFRLRWTELAGLRETHPFRPSLNEWRVYYRLLLELPEGGAQGERERARAQLEYVTALARRDPDYPAALASGVLYCKLGAYDRAAEAFRAHLAADRDGAWRLRVQNHMMLAMSRLHAATTPFEL